MLIRKVFDTLIYEICACAWAHQKANTHRVSRQLPFVCTLNEAHTHTLSLTHRQMEFILHGCCAKYSSVDNLHVDCTYCGVCNSDSIPVFKEICSMCLWKLFDRRRRRCSCCYCYFHALPFYCWLLCVVCLSCYRACWQFTTFPYRLKTNSISIINNLQMLILNDSQYKWHAKTRDSSRMVSKQTHTRTYTCTFNNNSASIDASGWQLSSA